METSAEKQELIEQLSAMMEALSSVVGQNMEIVLHDVTQPQASVLKIINGHVSGRKPGSSLLESPDNDLGFLGLLNQDEPQDPPDTRPTVYPDYPTQSSYGTPLRSATVMYKDRQGTPTLSLCFNADHRAIDAARAALNQLLPAGRGSEAPKSAASLADKMNDIILYALPPAGVLRTGATKAEKVEAVRKMQEKGLFIVRGGVETAAKALGVTRYTIYNYLDEIKQGEAE